MHLNSADRTSGTNENFTFALNMGLGEQYTHCCVLGASIPLSYYLVQDGYNTMTLQEGVSTATITLEPGNYNTQSFMVVVAALLTAGSPHGWTYTITMNNAYSAVNNGKFCFTVSGNGGVQPSFVFGSTLHEQFGFAANTTATFAANTLWSTAVVNFIPEQTLYVYSNLVETKDNNTNGILQELFASNAAAYSCVAYQCSAVEAYSKRINQNMAGGFSIVLQNEAGQVMNLNGRNMLLTILLFKKDNLGEMVKGYIKYRLAD